jgi:uncharacterized protein
MSASNRRTLRPASARIRVYVQPRASHSEIVGWHDGWLKIRLTAPPVDDAANVALIAFIAERLGIQRNRVRIVAGTSARRKVVAVEGIGTEALIAALV